MRRMTALLVACVLGWIAMGSMAWGNECHPAAPIGIKLNTGQQVKLTSGQYITTFTILSVDTLSLAEQKGLMIGDQVFAIEGEFARAYQGSGYHSTADLIAEIHKSAGHKITMFYFHPDDPQPRQVTLIVPLSPCGKQQWWYTQLWQTRDPLSRMASTLGEESEEDYERHEQTGTKDAAAQFRDLVRRLPDCTNSPFQTGNVRGCQDLEKTMEMLNSELIAIADNHQSLLATHSQMRTALRSEMRTIKEDIEQLRSDLDFNRGSPVTMETVSDLFQSIRETLDTLSKKVGAWEKDRVIRQRETREKLDHWHVQFNKARTALTRLQSEARVYTRRKQEEAQNVARQQAKDKFRELLARHQAEDLTRSLVKRLSITKNPYAYQNKNVYLDGMYLKNLSPTAAIVAISPAFDSTYIIQMDTARNLAETLDTVRCVMKVLDTVMIQQGVIMREIPHVEEVECLE
jgi:hypothetical protein